MGLTTGIKRRSGKGKRVIMLGIGSAETGFIDGAQETWVYDGNSIDYHDSMNAKKFNAWLERILPMLKTYSDKVCLILDNAKYHCVKADGTPDSKSKVGVLKKWILDQGLELPSHPIKKIYGQWLKILSKKTLPLKVTTSLKLMDVYLFTCPLIIVRYVYTV